jgi:hypothetical protein
LREIMVVGSLLSKTGKTRPAHVESRSFAWLSPGF